MMTKTNPNSVEPLEEEVPQKKSAFTVKVLPEEYQRFIPGPPRSRLSVVELWCEENVKGQWSNDGWTFIFGDKQDAEAFEASWNSRGSPVEDEYISTKMKEIGEGTTNLV